MGKEAVRYLEFIQGMFLFDRVDKRLVARALDREGASVRHFAAGEKVTGEWDACHHLGILTEGSAQVYKKAGGTSILMSVLKQGSVLGAVTLFRQNAGAVTEIVARRGCTVVFFSEALFRQMLRDSFALTENYIRYLTERIYFLTGRIESIACPTAADKLLNYLAQNAEGRAVYLPYGMSDLAEALSVSRATLYRIMEELEKQGRIRRDGKTIYIREAFQ